MAPKMMTKAQKEVKDAVMLDNASIPAKRQCSREAKLPDKKRQKQEVQAALMKDDITPVRKPPREELASKEKLTKTTQPLMIEDEKTSSASASSDLLQTPISSFVAELDCSGELDPNEDSQLLVEAPTAALVTPPPACERETPWPEDAAPEVATGAEEAASEDAGGHHVKPADDAAPGAEEAASEDAGGHHVKPNDAAPEVSTGAEEAASEDAGGHHVKPDDAAPEVATGSEAAPAAETPAAGLGGSAATFALLADWQRDGLSASAVSDDASISSLPAASAVSLDSIVALSNVATERGSPHCSKCGKEVDPMRAQVKSKQCEFDACKWICRECNCVVTNFSKNMTWPPVQFASMTEAEQRKFFCDSHETRVGNSRFNYSRLRACLCHTLTKQIVKTREAAVQGSFMPLSWYAAKGCTPEQLRSIEDHGESEVHPILGMTYRVPIKKITVSVASQEVEAIVAKAESAMTAKTANQLEDEGSALTSVEDQFMTEDDDKPEVAPPSASLAPPTPAPEKEKTTKEIEAEEKAAQKAKKDAEKQEKAATSKHNSSQYQLATKTVAILTPIVQKATASTKHAHFSQIPPLITEDHNAVLLKMKTSISECTKLLKASASAATKGTKLEALDFDLKWIQNLAKDAKSSQDKVDAILKVLK